MTHPDYHEIGKQFRRKNDWTDATPLVYTREQVDLYYLEHVSAHGRFLLGQNGYTCPEHGQTFPGEPTIGDPIDCLIEENIRFRYPLLREHADGPLRRHTSAVILLHGLNERSFTKYIPWAYQMWARMRFPVILFPIAYHINRVRRKWAADQRDIYERRLSIPGNEHAHRFNAVISERLTMHPERFLWGAIQTYWDIVDLVRMIRENRHPHFAPEAEVHLFGFSAGGYIALALLLENERNYFATSRGILFATCAAIREVNLASHLIIDHAAEIALMKLYVKYRDKLMNPRLRHWVEEHPEGRWLNAFCGLMPDRARLDARLRQIAPRLLAVAGTRDQVMTSGAMMNALQGIHRDTGVRLIEMDLGIHENPFSCPDYNQRERSMITEFLDVTRFGSEFDEFVRVICGHLHPGSP